MLSTKFHSKPPLAVELLHSLALFSIKYACYICIHFPDFFPVNMPSTGTTLIIIFRLYLAAPPQPLHIKVQGIIRAPLASGLHSLTALSCPQIAAFLQKYHCPGLPSPQSARAIRTVRACASRSPPVKRITAARTPLLRPAGMFPDDWYVVVNVQKKSLYLYNRQ